MRNLFRQRYLITTVFAFVAVGFLALVAFNISFLNPISNVIKEFSFTDIYYQILGHKDLRERNVGITLVDMTSTYSRLEIAQAITDIEQCGAKTIGVDIVFEDLLDDAEGNDSLVSVASRHDNIVFSYRLADYIDGDTGYGMDIHSFFSEQLPIIEGNTNMERSLYGNMKRNLSLKTKIKGEWKPSFISQVIRNYAGTESVIPEREMLDINFSPTDFDVVEYDSILSHRNLISNRIVLLGAMYEESDMHYTPIGKMAGVKLLAYSIHTIIDYKNLRPLSQFWFWAVTFLLVFITALWNDKLVKHTEGLRNRYLRAIFSSSYFVSIVTFAWMAALTWTAFILFCKYDISFNLGWAFATMACLEISKDLYEACQKIFGNVANNRNNEPDSLNLQKKSDGQTYS